MRLANFKYLVLTSALVLVSMPVPALADTDFGELAVSGDMSPQERLVKKTELTQNALLMAIEKAEAMKTNLEALELETASPEEGLRNQHLNEVAGYIAFYQEREAVLETATSLEEIDALSQTIIKYREEVYAPSAKNVLEFVLVFSYSPPILKTAEERHADIAADITRLSGLGLIEEEPYKTAIEECRGTLEEAAQLQNQAKEALLTAYQLPVENAETADMPTEGDTALTSPALDKIMEVSTTTDVFLTPKELAEASLNKIKAVYAIFIETGQKIKETLGI